MKTITIGIEMLDEGFIITKEGKRRAIATGNQVDEFLKKLIIDATSRRANINVNEMIISIEIEENPAKPAVG